MIGTQRPRSTEKRDKRIELRLSGSEKDLLAERARGFGMSVGAYLVSVALGQHPSQPHRGALLQELMAVRRQMQFVLGGWAEPPDEGVLAELGRLIERTNGVLNGMGVE